MRPGGNGWGLRNAKLLLICFGCQLNPTLQQEISFEMNKAKLALVSYVHEQTIRTPLEILAETYSPSFRSYSVASLPRSTVTEALGKL